MNAYNRLRPTTDVESCDCDVVTELVLVDLLTSNPIHCAACRREVDPERIGLTEHETEAVAEWHGVASSLYRLWLDSGEYEDDAKRWLLDPQGQVNKRGREIAVFLSTHHPTRLWYFHDEDDAIARDPGEHDRGLLTVPGAGADPQLPAQGSIIDAACALLDRQPGDASVAQPATQ